MKIRHEKFLFHEKDGDAMADYFHAAVIQGEHFMRHIIEDLFVAHEEIEKVNPCEWIPEMRGMICFCSSY